ncbi:MAG: sugar ABC transporter substrate-binding protein [Spirochaetales bacterium]|nr:sugar ABC transporter substrate-binding protein [Spirochaetales bacterium]
MKKVAIILLSLVMLASMGMSVFASGQQDGDKPLKVGLSFSDFDTERWSTEADAMEKLFTEAGCEVVIQVANHDAKLQNDQIDNMVTGGVDVLLIVAEDGAAAATAVDDAAAEGIKVIAYDRLIKSANLSAYISFDNVAVGEAQAKAIVERVPEGRFVMLGGSPTDNNAVLFRKGQMNIVQPLVDAGKIEIVADQWVENWDSATATTKMENILTAIDNGVDAVVASNDGTALGALQAMKAQGLAGVVPISGQDATAAGCKSIVEGELSMTVFKDLRKLMPLAVETTLALGRGESISGMTSYSLKELTGDNLSGDVPCKFLEVISVDADNVYEEVVKSGFQAYDEVYKDIPEDQRPPKV